MLNLLQNHCTTRPRLNHPHGERGSVLGGQVGFIRLPPASAGPGQAQLPPPPPTLTGSWASSTLDADGTRGFCPERTEGQGNSGKTRVPKDTSEFPLCPCTRLGSYPSGNSSPQGRGRSGPDLHTECDLGLRPARGLSSQNSEDTGPGRRCAGLPGSWGVLDGVWPGEPETGFGAVLCHS